jgi:hypothetical protein
MFPTQLKSPVAGPATAAAVVASNAPSSLVTTETAKAGTSRRQETFVMTGGQIIEIGSITAGIVVAERGGVRFFSSERRFDGLDGTIFRSVAHASRALHELASRRR